MGVPIVAHCVICGRRGPCECRHQLDPHVETLARTIIGEARGQSYLDMLAIACVVRERVQRPGWWGRDVAGVCRAPRQFTCWDDHNRAAVESAHTLPQWPLARAAAETAIQHMRDQDVGQLFRQPTPDRFPTHYHDHSIDTPNAWGDDLTEIKVGWDSDFRWYVVRQGRPPRK